MKNKVVLTFIFVSIGIALAVGYGNLIENATATVKEGKSIGEAAIGGSFTLTNNRGETVTDEDFRGKLMLVFFGFTNCPEVCPTGMMTVTKVQESLGDLASEIAPVFITVDSENDTVEKIASFIEKFHPSIQGLTGTEEQLKQAQEVYKVYAKKVEMDSIAGPMFNHSSFIYLMGRDGKYLTHFQYNTKPELIIEGIKKYL